MHSQFLSDYTKTTLSGVDVPDMCFVQLNSSLQSYVPLYVCIFLLRECFVIAVVMSNCKKRATC